MGFVKFIARSLQVVWEALLRAGTAGTVKEGTWAACTGNILLMLYHDGYWELAAGTTCGGLCQHDKSDGCIYSLKKGSWGACYLRAI